MSVGLLGLILGSVLLSAIAQLVLKLGMSSTSVQQALGQHDALRAIWSVATNWQVVGGLGLYALGAVVWLLVLARAEVSFAYPFMGIGFIATMLLGWAVLGEALGAARLSGTLLVVAGVWLVSTS
jgi:multidrug transporter EmrE-like cation transporter